MRRMVLLGAAALFGLSFSVGAAVPYPGVFLAVPGAVSGIPTSAPSLLFSDDPRAAAWNPVSGADRELPAFGFAAALAFPSGSGNGAGGYATLSAAVPTTIGTAWAVADGVLSASGLNSWAAPTGTSFVAGISKRAARNLKLGAGAGAVIADTEGGAWTLAASLGAELALPEIAPEGSELFGGILAAGPSLGGGDDMLPLIGATPIIALRSGIVETGRFSLETSALLAMPSFADFAAAVGVSFSLGSYVGLDLGWNWTIAGARESFDDGPLADEHRFQTFPSLALRFDGSSFLRFGGYGATLGGSYRPAGSGASAAEASAVFSRGERDTEGPQVSIAEGDREAYSPQIVDGASFAFDVRDASNLAEWRVTVFGPDGYPHYEVGDGTEEEPSDGIFRRLFSRKKSVLPPRTLVIPLLPTSRDGEYRIRAWARDERGNGGKIAERAFLVDGSPPSATVRLTGPALFSPNGDGVRDILTVVQEGSEESIWIGTFRSADGGVVRTFRWTDGAPATFTWDGRSDTGDLLADGEYSYELESVDPAGNRGTARISGLVIDAAATPLALTLDGRAMSTERDASSVSVVLSIDAPRNRGLSAWTIDLVGDDGKHFRSWKGSVDRLDIPPTSIIFDGRDTEGNVIPDGRYRFHAELDYTNGNRPSAVSAPFTVDSKPPSGRVRASSSVIAVDRGANVSFYHDLSSGADWAGLVLDENDRVVRRLRLEDTEAVAEWNGLDSEGAPVAAGIYRYLAEGRSAVGLVGRTAAVNVRVESGGLAAALIADRSRFSAFSGEGRLRFFPRSDRRDRIVSYSIEIKNLPSARVVRRFDGIASLPAALSWDGRDEFGTPVADGEYMASLSVLFDGGERTTADSARVILDSTPPHAILGLASEVFSPNGDGNLDEVEILQRQTSDETLWTGTVVDAYGNTLRTYTWRGAPAERVIWDGRDESGAVFADGHYRYRLSSVDAAGNAFVAETPVFILDARRPTATIAADKKIISPNGDGFADSLVVRVVPSFNDGLAAWSLRIIDANGTIVRSSDSATPASVDREVRSLELRWSGEAENKGRAADGEYRAVAELRYAKGDAVRVESSPFRVDTTPPLVSIAISPLPFSPDGDGIADELSIDIKAEDASPIAGWMLSVLDPAGFPFTSFSGRTLPAQPFMWDGRDLEGELVEAAQDYRYELIVRDALGNAKKVGGAIPVDVFVLRDGDRLKIRVSSIEFAPSSASLSVGDAAATAKNVAVLDRIASVLTRFPEYRIRVEGHAVNVSGTEREERSELAQLSLSRAQTVLEGLVARGVDRTRLEARGLGGREPIVPHGDVDGRWRNRRVEFILVR